MNVAIYARMSTDKQNTDSPADQIARCRAYADREDWTVTLEEQDAGVSGASRHNRPGLLELFANIDGWEVLLVKSRFSAEFADYVDQRLVSFVPPARMPTVGGQEEPTS